MASCTTGDDLDAAMDGLVNEITSSAGGPPPRSVEALEGEIERLESRGKQLDEEASVKAKAAGGEREGAD